MLWMTRRGFGCAKRGSTADRKKSGSEDIKMWIRLFWKTTDTLIVQRACVWPQAQNKNTNSLENKINPPTHAECGQSHWSSSWTRQRRQFLRHAHTDPMEQVVPLDNTTLENNSWRMTTSHFMMIWKEVSWNPLASETGWNNTFTQRESLAPTMNMFPSRRSLVFPAS